MQRVFQTFMDQLDASNDAAGLHNAMANAACAFGLQCFAYVRMPGGGRKAVGLISNYPIEWTDHYLRQRYECLDPVILSAHLRLEPFEWGLGADNQKLTSAQTKFFDEAAEFGIRCGLTIPIHDGRSPTAAVTFATDERRRPFRKTVTRHREALELMTLNLHAHVQRKLYPEDSINGVRFSPRERECLHWLAEGKSARDTGEILGIGTRTVVFHIENAKRKLGVRTINQALAMLARTTHNFSARSIGRSL